jgi:hypothetical protein
MTDPAPWIKFQRSHQVHVIGSFENEYGERYVIWRNENGDTPYFTGDEVDWEPKNRLLGADFRFNADERAKIAAILWRVPEDFMLNGEAPGRACARPLRSPHHRARPCGTGSTRR